MNLSDAELDNLRRELNAMAALKLCTAAQVEAAVRLAVEKADSFAGMGVSEMADLLLTLVPRC